MIFDLDIYRAANLVIKRHGAEAVIEAARMTDACLNWAMLRAVTYGGVSTVSSKHCRRRRMEFAIGLAVNSFLHNRSVPQQKPTTRMERRARSRTDGMTERRALSWDG